MRLNYYHRTCYRLNADRYTQLPEDSGLEVAFSGRSNAGKSSVINCVTQQKSLARTSKTPGRTQHLVCFDIDDDRRLIDLPGYGYARVNNSVKSHWTELIEQYFYQRQSLVGLLLIMDVRHPLREYDHQMLSWCAAQSLPVHVLLNKADKLSKGAAKNTLLSVSTQLQKPVSVQLFSVLKKQGMEQLLDTLDTWFLLTS